MSKASSSRYPPPQPAMDSDDDDYSSSSEDVSEDEFGEELTLALDAAILQTLGKIKRKEGVYSGENVLQEALKEAEKKAGSLGVKTLQRMVAAKPFLLADHHRTALLDGTHTQFNEDEDGGYQEEPLTNVQEQRMLREKAVSAFKGLADDSDDEEEAEAGFLKPRTKDEKEAEEDDEEYRRFLLEMGGGEAEVRKILGMGEQAGWTPAEEAEVEVKEDGKKKKKKEDKKDKKDKKALGGADKEKKEKADDDFLMNYILNRGWIDRSEEHVPTYDEVVGKRDDEEQADNVGESSHPWGELDEDDFDEKADEFETAYNFRYEEPGATDILTHPRNISTLVRREDDARKLKRQARLERKAAEKAAAEEETRRLKGEKRREMESQIEALKKELGEGMDWTALENVLEGEWDEEEWERVVGTMLNDAADKEDADKPVFDDLDYAAYDENDDGGYEEYAFGPNGGDVFADEQFDDDDDAPINMDADYLDEQPSKKRKKDKKGKEKAVEAEPGLSVAERAEKVKKTLDEYKALDHEDMIGDTATRFKYTRSAPLDLGLTPAEILLATDAELNALTSVRHIAPYRRGGLGRTGQGLGKRIRDLKTILQRRKWGEEDDIEVSHQQFHHPKPGRLPGSGANTDLIGTKRKWGQAMAPGEGQAAKAGTIVVHVDGQRGPKKRLGKKQRMRAKLAEGGEPAASSGGGEIVPAGGEMVNQETGGKDGEAKKRRKKKKKSAAE